MKKMVLSLVAFSLLFVQQSKAEPKFQRGCIPANLKGWGLLMKKNYLHPVAVYFENGGLQSVAKRERIVFDEFDNWMYVSDSLPTTNMSGWTLKGSDCSFKLPFPKEVGRQYFLVFARPQTGWGTVICCSLFDSSFMIHDLGKNQEQQNQDMHYVNFDNIVNYYIKVPNNWNFCRNSNDKTLVVDDNKDELWTTKELDPNISGYALIKVRHDNKFVTMVAVVKGRFFHVTSLNEGYCYGVREIECYKLIRLVDVDKFQKHEQCDKPCQNDKSKDLENRVKQLEERLKKLGG